MDSLQTNTEEIINKFKPQETKEAKEAREAKETITLAKNCFKLVGKHEQSLCMHGLPFFACMPCSH